MWKVGVVGSVSISGWFWYGGDLGPYHAVNGLGCSSKGSMSGAGPVDLWVFPSGKPTPLLVCVYSVISVGTLLTDPLLSPYGRGSARCAAGCLGVSCWGIIYLSSLFLGSIARLGFGFGQLSRIHGPMAPTFGGLWSSSLVFCALVYFSKLSRLG